MDVSKLPATLARCGLIAATPLFAQVPAVSPEVLDGDLVPGVGDASVGTLLSAVLHAGSGSPGLAVAGRLNLTAGGTVTSLLVAQPLNALALEGQSAPGTSASFASLFSVLPNMSDAAVTVFRADLTGAGVDPGNATGFWTGSAQGVQLLARLGGPAAGLSSAHFTTFDGTASINGLGQAAFNALTDSPSGTAEGLWLGVPGNLVLVAQSGSASCGCDYLSGFGPPLVNDAGMLAAAASSLGPSGPRSLILAGSPPAARAASKGNPPGQPQGVEYSALTGTFGFNAAGRVAFTGTMAGTGITSANAAAIWSDASGTMQEIVRDGNQAAGCPAGVVYAGGAGYFPVLANSGHIAFKQALQGAGVSSASNMGLFVRRPDGSTVLLARKGDQAANLPAGVVYAGFVGEPAMNGSGQVVFVSQLDGPTVGSSNDLGLFATDRSGAVRRVLWKGETISLGGGTTRVLGSFSIVGGSGGGDGRPRAVNESDVVLQASLGSPSGAGVLRKKLPVTPPGDLNGDGILDIFDVVILQGFIVGNVLAGSPPFTVSSFLAGDLNRDQVVDIFDLVLLQGAVVGNVASLPV